MKFKVRVKRRSGFDMTPMIDIVFLLIIFFMVSTTLVKTRGMAVKLPESKTSDAETKNIIVISIVKNGALYVNEEKTTLKQLGRKLKSLSVELSQDTVIIKPHRDAPTFKLVDVMDISKLAGMKAISIATTQKR